MDFLRRQIGSDAPRSITPRIAEPAVDAWVRRLLPSTERSHRPDGSITAFEKEIERARGRARDALVRAVVDTGIDAEICRTPARGKERLAEGLRERSGLITARVRHLERTVGRSRSMWRRYRPLIKSIRCLDDQESDAVEALFREISLVLTLSERTTVSWFRRI